MKKLTRILSIATLLVVVGIFFASSSKVDANPSTLSVNSLAQYSGLTNPLAIASSSATYLVAGTATTTFVALTDGADQAELNIYAVGTSTSSIINVQVDYSDDYGCYTSPSSCNWYREDVNSTSGAVITQQRLPFRTWSPSSAATSTQSVRLTNVGARFTRVGLAAQGANSTVWAQLTVKGQRN